MNFDLYPLAGALFRPMQTMHADRETKERSDRKSSRKLYERVKPSYRSPDPFREVIAI